MSERWAVTGASGYIGRALVAELSGSGIAVRSLSRHPLPGDHVVGDVRDVEAVRRLVLEASVVVHLAAYVHRVPRRAAERTECWSVNFEGTRTVIDAVASVNPGAFVIFVSSASVYPAREEPIDESVPPEPRSEYGRSKLAAERELLSAIGSGCLRGCVLRPSIVFGPGAPGNLQRLLRMVRRGIAILPGGGNPRKTLVPVETLVAAIRAVAARRADVNGVVLNVAGGPAMTMREIVDTIASATGRRVRLIAVPPTLILATAAAVDQLTRWLPLRLPSFKALAHAFLSSAVLSDERLRRTTGFEPPISAPDALRRLGIAASA